MSEAKVTVKTDEFEVELPCEMEVNLDGLNWNSVKMTGYDTDSHDWIDECGGEWQYPRLIQKKKMIPWTIEDFECGMVVRSEQKPENLFSIIGVLVSKGTLQVGFVCATLDEMLGCYTQADGTPFEKEAK